MNDEPRKPARPDDSKEETNPRDGALKEAPATQGLKTPPAFKDGEDSGEWTRGGGSDPNESSQPDAKRDPREEKGED